MLGTLETILSRPTEVIRMNGEKDLNEETANDSVPDDWENVKVEKPSENVRVVKRVQEDGSIPALAIEGHSRPILVEVHFGPSAIVPTPLDAVRYGYQKRGVRTEFYYLDIVYEPTWVQINEEMDDPEISILEKLDNWVSAGDLSEAEAQWARDQWE